MSSMVCQKDTYLCFEPLVSEPFCMKNNYNQPKSHQSPQLSLIPEHQNEHQGEFDNKNNKIRNKLDYANNNVNVGSWSLIESLSNKNKRVNHDENVYVHPLVKNSSSILSLKSLEMCTESLGSETGSDISESDDFFLPLSPKTNDEYGQIRRLKKISRKVSETSFPPPLTSITRPENIQLTPNREGGRLVLKASTVFPNNPYFQYERVDGRLRLFLVEDYSPNSEYFDINGELEQQQEEEYCDDEDVEGNMRTMEGPMPSKCKEEVHDNKGMPKYARNYDKAIERRIRFRRMHFHHKRS